MSLIFIISQNFQTWGRLYKVVIFLLFVHKLICKVYHVQESMSLRPDRCQLLYEQVLGYSSCLFQSCGRAQFNTMFKQGVQQVRPGLLNRIFVISLEL